MRLTLDLLGHRLDVTLGPVPQDAPEVGEHDCTAAQCEATYPGSDEDATVGFHGRPRPR